MSYITAEDIKSNLVSGFDIQGYIEEADQEVTDIAEKLGVRDASSIVTPIHYKIKRYAVVFVLMRLAQDKMGTNNVELAAEKYGVLYDMYKAELKDLYPQITYEMLTGTVDSIVSRTSSFGGFYRG